MVHRTQFSNSPEDGCLCLMGFLSRMPLELSISLFFFLNYTFRFSDAKPCTYTHLTVIPMTDQHSQTSGGPNGHQITLHKATILNTDSARRPTLQGIPVF